MHIASSAMSCQKKNKTLGHACEQMNKKNRFMKQNTEILPHATDAQNLGPLCQVKLLR